MKRLLNGLWFGALLSTLLLGMARPGFAGTEIKVFFSGSCVSTGYFYYDDSKGCNTPPANSGNFTFPSATPIHGLSSLLTGASAAETPSSFSSFVITTPSATGGGTSFQLVAKYTGSNGSATTVQINLTTITTINGTNLPTCDAFYSENQVATGKFIKTVAGNEVANCSINVVSCDSTSLVVKASGQHSGYGPLPSGQAGGYGGMVYLPLAISQSPISQPSAVYSCDRPRECCLSRLFARRRCP